jgi:energy-coupling factor transport system ATP-binding protein
MGVVELSEVSFTYRVQPDEERALDDVSLSIESGQVIGVTGPSDAGKSSLGRLIASYIPNYFEGDLEGEVRVGEHDVRSTDIGDMSDTVGLLFENPFDQLTGASNTVFEEVAFGLENQGIPRQDIIDITTEKLNLAGVMHLYDRNPRQLSGGQSQRVALASILAMEPEVLVLDEPTSQLDPHGTEEVLNVVTDLADEGYTIIVVSHDLSRLAPNLDRLLVMDEGRIVGDDSPQELFRAAEDPPFALPDAARIGRRLRREGWVPEERPLPLTLADVLDEVEPRVVERPAPERERRDLAPSSTDGTPAVRFDGAHFFYDEDVHALRGLSVDIDAGCVCLIGQNGAGKSTFLKHLNGLLTPDEGEVLINGLDTDENSIAEMAREAGVSFQNPDNQLFHSDVESEIRYGPKNLGYEEERIDDLVEEAIERMELDDIREKNPYDVGLARRKHIAVASVLAMDTPVVALDEPTGSQDAAGVEVLGDVVDRLVEEGKTVVVITHDMDFVRDQADRVVALETGDLLLDGSAREVFGQPEALAETDVEGPFITRLGERLGIEETVLTVEELFDYLE